MHHMHLNFLHLCYSGSYTQKLMGSLHIGCSSSVLLYKRSGQVSTQNQSVSLEAIFSILWYILYPYAFSCLRNSILLLFGNSETVSSVN